MTLVWVAVLVVGVVAASAASSRAVGAALAVSDSLGVSHGLIGLTVLAVGTDLPEIANSISASLSGHGDINVGDSAGSALAQITLVLGFLLLVAGAQLDLHTGGSRIAITIGGATVVALVLLAILLADGRLGRVDGVVLVAGWVVSVGLIQRREGGRSIRVPRYGGDVAGGIATTLGWLVVVGGAATLVVRAFVELADRFGVPEFIASALVLSVGTSMPELVVDWTAIRRNASALAIGDLFGSSLVDSTLSVGIGPIVRATPIGEGTMNGVLVIAVGCALATALVAFAGAPRRTAMWLLAVYAGTTVSVVAIVG